MKKLFPRQSEAFTHWVSGTLKIQAGELFEYVHMGYESIYETNIYLKFENGILIEEKTSQGYSERLKIHYIHYHESLNASFNPR